MPRLTLLRPAGPPRHVRLGSQHVAEAPVDADFDHAALWRIDLPPGLPPEALLRVRFTGDVARIHHNGTLLNDHFFHGREFDCRIPAGAESLELRILPLSLDAPIHLHPSLRAALGTQGQALELHSVTLVLPRSARLSLPA